LPATDPTSTPQRTEKERGCESSESH
jgi:hypothetical protein